MVPLLQSVLALVFLSLSQASQGTEGDSGFILANGQVYTPGLSIIDSPQPFTPEGGSSLQVAIDVSGKGRLPWPPLPPNCKCTPTQIDDITIFLYSYTTGYNFTISNGTWDGESGATTKGVLGQEAGSTVKHVNWMYPDCLAGDNPNGHKQGSTNSPGNGPQTARGWYNISIHESFTLNSTAYYTIFDLPIDISNSISADTNRPSCASLDNTLLSWTSVNGSVHEPDVQPWIGSGQSVMGTTDGPGSTSPSPSSSSSSDGSDAGGDGDGGGGSSGNVVGSNSSSFSSPMGGGPSGDGTSRGNVSGSSSTSSSSSSSTTTTTAGVGDEGGSGSGTGRGGGNESGTSTGSGNATGKGSSQCTGGHNGHGGIDSDCLPVRGGKPVLGSGGMSVPADRLHLSIGVAAGVVVAVVLWGTIITHDIRT